MSEKLDSLTRGLMNERFGRDTLISVATVDENGLPHVRIVDGYYESGSFYAVTYAMSEKMKQLAKNRSAAVCGEWFTASGIGENMGWVRDESNSGLMKKLREAFASWYSNGHTNEDDPNTCILRIRLTDGVLMSHGTRYELDFRAENGIE